MALHLPNWFAWALGWPHASMIARMSLNYIFKSQTVQAEHFAHQSTTLSLCIVCHSIQGGRPVALDAWHPFIHHAVCIMAHEYISCVCMHAPYARCGGLPVEVFMERCLNRSPLPVDLSVLWLGDAWWFLLGHFVPTPFECPWCAEPFQPGTLDPRKTVCWHRLVYRAI